MKISNAIATLQKIQEEFGDISITGGAMADDVPPSQIIVTDNGGREIWPDRPNGEPDEDGEDTSVDGVFIE